MTSSSRCHWRIFMHASTRQRHQPRQAATQARHGTRNFRSRVAHREALLQCAGRQNPSGRARRRRKDHPPVQIQDWRGWYATNPATNSPYLACMPDPLLTEFRVIIRQLPQSRPLASTPRNSSTKTSSFQCGMWAARLPVRITVPRLSVDGTRDQVPCQCGFVMVGGFLIVAAGEDPSPVEVLLSGSARNHFHGRFVGP